MLFEGRRRSRRAPSARTSGTHVTTPALARPSGTLASGSTQPGRYRDPIYARDMTDNPDPVGDLHLATVVINVQDMRPVRGLLVGGARLPTA